MGKLWGDAQCPSLCRGHLEGPGLAPCGAEDICPGLPRQGVALSPVTTSEREALGSLSSAGRHPPLLSLGSVLPVSDPLVYSRLPQ